MNMKPSNSLVAKEVIGLLLAAFLILFGVVMITGTLVQWFDHTSKYSLGTDLTVFLLLGLLPAGGGALLFTRTIRRSRQRRYEAFESTIYKLAAGMQNRLTAGDIAAHTELPIAEARRLLDRFCVKGVARLEVSESGVKVYWFWELVSDEEKLHAETI
jgi:hypothetical protein